MPSESVHTLYCSIEHLGMLTSQTDYVERWKDLVCSVARPENAVQSERAGFDMDLVHAIVDRFITRKEYLHPERHGYDTLGDLLAADARYGTAVPRRTARQDDEHGRRSGRERERERERDEKRARVHALEEILSSCNIAVQGEEDKDVDAHIRKLEGLLNAHLAQANTGTGGGARPRRALASMDLIVREGKVWPKASDPPIDYGAPIRERVTLQCPGHLNMASPPTVEGTWNEWNKTPEGKRGEAPPKHMVMPHFLELCSICISDVEKHCEQCPADKPRYLVYYEADEWAKRVPPAGGGGGNRSRRR